MPSITGSVEIACSADDAFRYSTDVPRRTEWQDPVKEIVLETPGPAASGSRVREVRHVPGGARPFHWEFTDFEPGSRWSFRGVDGPVRPSGTMTFTPLGGGDRTRVDFSIEFQGRGLGKLFAALARRSSPKQIASDLGNLKRRLESGAAAR